MWTLTYTKEKLIDAFHRGLLRISINVRYPKIIKSTKLYTLTQQTPLSAGGHGSSLKYNLRWFTNIPFGFIENEYPF